MAEYDLSKTDSFRTETNGLEREAKRTEEQTSLPPLPSNGFTIRHIDLNLANRLYQSFADFPVDVLLRDILQKIPQKFVYLLAGKKGIKILDNTLPSVKERKADLVIELEDNSIFHLELQTYPDKNMPLRMLEYRVLPRLVAER